jgi:ribosomal protein S21
MGIRIVVGEPEPIGLALKRFKRLLERQGVTWEIRRRVHFTDPSQARRAKRFQKRFKSRRATLLAQRAGEQRQRLFGNGRGSHDLGGSEGGYAV